MKSILFFVLSLFIFGSSAFANYLQDEILNTADSVERKASRVRDMVSRNIHQPRELGRKAERRITGLQQEISRLQQLIRRYSRGGHHGRYRWVHVGDFPPAQCAGTAQAGDSNPHIVNSPLDMGFQCNQFNLGQTFCDAGFQGRYLDRHWRCARR